MPPEETSADYTALAVQIGVVQEGLSNVLSGVNDIKKTLSTHGDRIGNVESKVAVTESRIDGVEETLKESRPEKGRAWGIAGVLAAIAAVIYSVLSPLYGIGH